MLRLLRIRNLAVIEAAEVDFQSGFNALTGETGAGKSILVDAVELLLGGRASADLVRTGQDQATVEAVFEDGGEERIVRREVGAQGRSRAYVDGVLYTAAQLKDLVGALVEIHGQHDQQHLLNPDTHLSVLDTFAGLDGDRARAGQVWDHLRRAREALARATMDARERTARLEWVRFQLAELDALQPKPGEDDALHGEKQRLVHADRVQRLCQEGHDLLVERDGAAMTLLGVVWKRVEELSHIDPTFLPLAEGKGAVNDALTELGRTLVSVGESMEDAGPRLAQVENRLADLDRLKRTHGPGLPDVLDKWAALRSEREQLEERTAPEALEAEARRAEAAFVAVARQLSQDRQREARRFGDAIRKGLAALGMAGTRFDVRFAEAPASEWGPNGMDRAEFFFSANVGEDLRPLARIASGGELSRVMLALHQAGLALGTRDDGRRRTLIFDEVDAGIGGAAAEAVGDALRALGNRFQVLCITHLAAIAAKADAHFSIEKQHESGRTTTRVRTLRGDDRVAEVARMLAGTLRSDAIDASARQLLEPRLGAPGESQTDGKRRKRKSAESGLL